MNQKSIDTTADAKPMPRISVAASYVRLASTCMARQDIRHYLNGVRIEPRREGGAYIVATNGHHLIAIIDPKGECSDPVTIAPNAATMKACPLVNPLDAGHAKLRTIELECQAALMVTDNEDMPLHVQPRLATIDGSKYPEWRTRVLPDWSKLQPGSPEQVSAIYRNAPLAAFRAGLFQEVQSYVEPGRELLVQMWFGMRNVVHLVMPQRTQHDTAEWMKTWSAANEGGAA